MSALQPADDLLDEDEMLDADEAAEEINEDEDGDHPMSEDDGEEEIQQEIQLQNDSSAHFDAHTDSIFCIAQHPTLPHIVATGGGDDVAYVFDSTVAAGPVLPTSYATTPEERASIAPFQKLDGHTDSVNAITFTYPAGQYLLTAGLDGKLRAWMCNKTATKYINFAEATEVEEINWLIACPNPEYPNTVALGANDGSVWVYTIDAKDKHNPLTAVQVYYLHTQSCTAGAWTPDGKLLGTVGEDGAFHVWDVFETGAAVVSLTAEDQRFAVEGGLYSVAMTQSIAAVGGAGGNIKIVGLPQGEQEGKSKKGEAGSTGQILAGLQAQTEGVETLSFAEGPLTLLAAGSVDGSIALFDTAHRFAVRRHIKEAHEEFAVVKVEFGKGGSGHILTTAGMDGVVRRWDTRGGTAAAGQGYMKEWKGHRGEGEGGGVLGFVQGGGGSRIVTAGDDGVSLVFKADLP
jgi:ribosome assembly protein SQT1